MCECLPALPMFENDVKMYGTETGMRPTELLEMFENDVKMYGTETSFILKMRTMGLRMM